MRSVYIILLVPAMCILFVVTQGWAAGIGMSILIYINPASSLTTTLVMQAVAILVAVLLGCAVILPSSILIKEFSIYIGFFIGSLTTIFLIIMTGFEMDILSQYIALIVTCTFIAWVGNRVRDASKSARKTGSDSIDN